VRKTQPYKKGDRLLFGNDLKPQGENWNVVEKLKKDYQKVACPLFLANS
jgi:hypothetical protein